MVTSELLLNAGYVGFITGIFFGGGFWFAFHVWKYFLRFLKVQYKINL